MSSQLILPSKTQRTLLNTERQAPAEQFSTYHYGNRQFLLFLDGHTSLPETKPLVRPRFLFLMINSSQNEQQVSLIELLYEALLPVANLSVQTKVEPIKNANP